MALCGWGLCVLPTFRRTVWPQHGGNSLPLFLFSFSFSICFVLSLSLSSFVHHIYIYVYVASAFQFVGVMFIPVETPPRQMGYIADSLCQAFSDRPIGRSFRSNSPDLRFGLLSISAPELLPVLCEDGTCHLGDVADTATVRWSLAPAVRCGAAKREARNSQGMDGVHFGYHR